MKKYVSVILCLSMFMALVSCSSTSDRKDTHKRDRDEEKEEETEDTEESSEETAASIVTGDKVTFSTVDRDGNTVDDSVFAEHDLTLINFWEPWCGPCVGEIPDLELLYENYSDEGLLIIGVYSEEYMEDDVDAVLSDSGVTYPVLRYTSEFDIYQSGYVPTTILVDRNGNIIDTGESYEDLDSTLIVGSRTYDEWEDIVTLYLGD
ncbi:MAG: TlpA family protein disulfide reductase [Clostridiales bacterium]|nr:TlpA family protein disulfide reductase [Clostridiales bacterium]